MIQYAGYLISNLVFTLLIVTLLGWGQEADSFTLVVALLSASAGVTQSLSNSVLLKVSEGERSAGSFHLSAKNLILYSALSSICSMFLTILIGSILVFISGFIPESSDIGLFNDPIVVFCSLFVGLAAFIQSLRQRMGEINIFYKDYLYSTLLAIILLLLFLFISEVGFVYCVLLFGLRSLFVYLFMVLGRKRYLVAGSDVCLETKDLLSLMASGCVAKINPPFDRMILTMIGEGYATVYHFVTMIMGAAAKYIDVNILYKKYINARSEFSIYRDFSFRNVKWLFFIWFAISLLLVIFLEVKSSNFLREEVLFEPIFILYVSLFSVWLAFPMLVSGASNTLFVLYFYEMNYKRYLAVLSLVSSLMAFLVKSVVYKFGIVYLVPVILNLQFVIMILLMQWKYSRKNMS